MMTDMRRSTAITLVLLGGGVIATAVLLENEGGGAVYGGWRMPGGYGAASPGNAGNVAANGKNTVAPVASSTSRGGFGLRGFLSSMGS